MYSVSKEKSVLISLWSLESRAEPRGHGVGAGEPASPLEATDPGLRSPRSYLYPFQESHWDFPTLT